MSGVGSRYIASGQGGEFGHAQVNTNGLIGVGQTWAGFDLTGKATRPVLTFPLDRQEEVGGRKS